MNWEKENRIYNNIGGKGLYDKITASILYKNLSYNQLPVIIAPCLIIVELKI